MGSNPTSFNCFLYLYMFFHLKISAKDKNVLKLFFKTLAESSEHISLIKHLSYNNAMKRITVLKSPHVNKLSQEQFEYRLYECTLKISSSQILKEIIKLKQLKEETFAGIKLKTKLFYDKQMGLASNFQNMNPNSMSLDFLKDNSKKSLILIARYIQLFDCEGESFLKKSIVIE